MRWAATRLVVARPVDDAPATAPAKMGRGGGALWGKVLLRMRERSSTKPAHTPAAPIAATSRRLVTADAPIEREAAAWGRAVIGAERGAPFSPRVANGSIGAPPSAPLEAAARDA